MMTKATAMSDDGDTDNDDNDNGIDFPMAAVAAADKQKR